MFQDTCALYANRIIAVLFRKVKLNGRKYSLRCLSALFYICCYTSLFLQLILESTRTSGRKYFSDLVEFYKM